MLGYFNDLFALGSVEMAPMLECVEKRVSDATNDLLIASFTLEEFRTTIFQMHSDKSPGPDGLNPAFFQRFWPLLGNDVFISCSTWLNELHFPAYLNATNIVLIPKVDSRVYERFAAYFVM